jgi:uncharacterized membrane protein
MAYPPDDPRDPGDPRHRRPDDSGSDPKDAPRDASFEPVERAPGPLPGRGGARNNESMPATVVYVLYLASLISGVTSIVGVVVAYLYRGKGADWLDSHFTFQIRTFWMLLLWTVVGGLLTIVLIGYLVLLGAAVWLIVRCVKGLQTLGRGEAYPRPETWTW